jgi:NitT/TauT family transport system substrate-binding protein
MGHRSHTDLFLYPRRRKRLHERAEGGVAKAVVRAGSFARRRTWFPAKRAPGTAMKWVELSSTMRESKVESSQDTATVDSVTPRLAEGLTRKTLLARTGVGLGVLAAGGVVKAVPALAQGRAPAFVKSRPTVVLGWGGATCEAPLYTAYHKGFFADEGLNVELYREGGSYDDNATLSSGKLDGAPGILFSRLKPIEQGADIRLAGGLHGNCLRLVVGKKAGINKATDFKGKTIGVDSLGGSAMSFFILLLALNGVDPQKDITWKVYDPTLLGVALDKGEIQAAAAPDPFAYTLILQGKATQVGNNILGLYGNTAGITTHKYCCTISLSGKLVRDKPKVAAAVTRAWLKGSRYAGNHTHEVSVIETKYKYVPLAQPIIQKLLDTYLWIPSATAVQQDILVGARSFKQSGFLDANTNPDKLAQVAYVNVFKLAGEPVPTF